MSVRSFTKRLKIRVGIQLAALAWPAAAFGSLAIGYQVVRWLYGGREAFISTIVTDPLENRYYDVNPSLIYRDAPLSRVPQHITDLPTGDPTAAARATAEIPR